MWRIFGKIMKCETAKGLIAKCQFFNQPKVIGVSHALKISQLWIDPGASALSPVTRMSHSAVPVPPILLQLMLPSVGSKLNYRK